MDRDQLVPGLLTMAWVGVNTWIVLDLVLAVLDQIGIRGGVELKVVVALVIMAVQLPLALCGFYAIRAVTRPASSSALSARSRYRCCC